MRELRYIFVLLTLALMVQGCERADMDVMGGDRMVTLSVDINSDGGRATTSLVEDYHISRLRIFAIGDGGVVENNEYASGLSISSSSALYELTVTQSARKRLYVVVNEPTSLTATLDAVSHESELARLSYRIAEAVNNEAFISGSSIEVTNRALPMTTKVEVDASRNNDVVVYVDRVVARVDLMVDKDEKAYTTQVEFNADTKISVDGLYYTTSLFEPMVLPSPSLTESVTGKTLGKSTTLKLETESRSSAQRLLSFYIAEQLYDESIEIRIDNITLDGVVTPINSTIVLGKSAAEPLERIERNHVYRIFATYKGEDKVVTTSDEYAIVDWRVLELDGDIEGVMLAVENRVVMDWTRLNNSFTASNIAFGSNRTIHFRLPTSYDEVSGEYEYAECGFVAQSGASYDLLDMSEYGVESNLLNNIPWLTKARVTFTSLQSGYFEFEYQLGATPSHLDSFPIELVSGNVRKRMEVIYDNGHVPGALLQANDAVNKCWGAAPNGIIFAKRGAALHPALSDEVLRSNSAGLYEGDVQLTATELASDYCRRELGAMWYAPNAAQLADIERHVKELGTSYRFNNAVGSLYWSSESDEAGYSWAIDFAKRLLDEPEAQSLPDSELHYVRCIANL